MKLYSAPLSLFARKVEIALAEKGVPFERVMVPFTQTEGYEPRDPEVLRINPKRQVPVLVDDDLELYDSTVILEYLEDAHPAVPLLPSEPRLRATCRLWELFADEVMLAAIRPLLYRTAPRASDPATRAAIDAEGVRAEAVVEQRYADLERRLAGRSYLVDAFSIADIAAFLVTHYALRLGGPRLDGHPGVQGWYRRIATRPAVARILDEIAAADRLLSFPIDGSPRLEIAPERG